MPTKNAPVNALLRGGLRKPDEHEVLTHVEDLDETFKLRVENRYDHFAPTDEFVRRGDSELRVFRYARHTYIAE
ncbi:DUF5988 family protein [Streptomyces canus]|jgi:hypothetical protein|uniref:DUF5988 family protein n=1 Tax=Streptomyces canus TaxID=58343 RepID=UPI002DDC197F|nr:DUF5988 family protein [Streptomyces canus]WSD83007.1 DUF5988 family protein [Streptomyces canus]WSD91825.1 DUF5988 family protein [Streptomyces canus]